MKIQRSRMMNMIKKFSLNDYEAFKILVDDTFGIKKINFNPLVPGVLHNMTKSDVSKVKKLMKIYNYVLFLKTRYLSHSRDKQERAEIMREQFACFSAEHIKYMLCRLKIILLIKKYGSILADGITGEYLDYVYKMHMDAFDGYDFYKYTYMLKALRYEYMGMLSGNIKVIKAGDFINYMRSIEIERR